MKRNLKQEICPVCGTVVARMHAVAHYRAHVRRGELIGGCLVGDKHTRFRLPGTVNKPSSWWRQGQSVGHTRRDSTV